MEIRILDFLQTLRTPFLDKFFSIFTLLGNRGEIWILIFIVLFFNKKTKSVAIYGFIALVLSALSIEVIIKPIIQRPRPFVANPLIELLIKEPFGYSFPSGHATSSFAAAFFLYLNKVKYRTVYLLLAILMAFSRLYVYVHYPSDVLVGVLLGMLIALGVNKQMKKDKKITLN